jgi:hypothetical protein
MTLNALTDRTRPPSSADMESVLGPAADLWLQLDGRLRAVGAIPRWCWGGRNGWELAYRRAGKPLVTVVPDPPGFTALLVLGREAASAVADAPISFRTRMAFDLTEQLHDGRWFFLRVVDRSDVCDAWTLITLKLPPTVRKWLADDV